VIIPVLNEAETIGAVVGAAAGDVVDEVIVVDGGSTDETVARARAAGARVILEPRSGYGAACVTGVRATDRPVVAFIDGDCSDEPAEIRRLVAPILAGEQDFVIGSRARGVREKGSMGVHQLIAGHVAGLVIPSLYGLPYTDM